MNYRNLIHKSCQLAWAPTNFVVDQNVKLLRSLAGNNHIVEQLDQQWIAAQEHTYNLIRHTVEQAERSIPKDIESFSEQERQGFVLQALDNAQSHLLAAIGEIYKAARVLGLEHGQVIEHDSGKKNLSSLSH